MSEGTSIEMRGGEGVDLEGGGGSPVPSPAPAKKPAGVGNTSPTSGPVRDGGKSSTTNPLAPPLPPSPPGRLEHASSAWSMHSHLEDAETVREKDKARIKEKGGMGALRRIYALKKELVEEMGDEKVVDAAGVELPLTLSEVVRTKAVVDEAGLMNIVDSEEKVKVAARSNRPTGKLGDVALRMLVLYSVITFALMVCSINPDVYDQGEGACHEAESLKIMMQMDMSTTEGLFLCTDSTCSATMAVTMTGVENGWNSTSSFSEAEDICQELKDRNWFFILIAMWIQLGIAIWSSIGGFYTMLNLRSLLARSKDADPNVMTISNMAVTFGSLFVRMTLILGYSNHYAADYVTLFVDLFLVFVFAELMDIFVARFTARPSFYDFLICLSFSAIRFFVSLQSCLPSFFDPYSSALNAKFKMKFKVDDKKRHVKEDEKFGLERRHLYYVEMNDKK